MKLTLPTRATARWAAGLLVAAGLALGIGTQPAAADDPPAAPTVMSLRLEAPDAYITFRDNADEEHGFYLELRERDHPDRVALEGFLPTGGVPGVGRVATRSVSGIKPGVAYCATLVAYGSDDLVVFVPFPVPVTLENPSVTSNAVCTDPAVQAGAPDLALAKIGGREEREWTQVKDQAPAYLVNLRNDGAAAAGTVVSRGR